MMQFGEEIFYLRILSPNIFSLSPLEGLFLLWHLNELMHLLKGSAFLFYMVLWLPDSLCAVWFFPAKKMALQGQLLINWMFPILDDALSTKYPRDIGMSLVKERLVEGDLELFSDFLLLII